MFTINKVQDLDVIETKCVGACDQPHRIDSGHPEYGAVKAALERGDRSLILCYHKAARN